MFCTRTVFKMASEIVKRMEAEKVQSLIFITFPDTD